MKAIQDQIANQWEAQRKAIADGSVIDAAPLDLPETSFETEGVWFSPAEWLLDVGVELAKFLVVTPLPGSEYHYKSVRESAISDWDFYQY